ncbi:MAG: L-2-hydroxyglutarate oxidase [Verrucomicrobiota bacterium]
MKPYDYLVIGGGIVGISTAYHLGQSFPGARVLLIEKEAGPARHQTGRNSGVIHSGIYYKPGSFKAMFAKSGARSMVEFCQQHGITYNVCGKVIVATKDSEVPLLESLYQRGLQNDVPVEKVSAERVREIEPHVTCVAGVLVKSTGITSYVEVCQKLLELTTATGGEVRFGQSVRRIHGRDGVKIIETESGEFATKFVINCAGLHSDRVARMAGDDPGARIVPFRGEYFELLPDKQHLVNTLIYPVPNPDFPFLGVHFTKMIDGSVHAGPNAVLAMKREGYFKTDFNLRDFSETIAFGGFWKLIGKNLGEGLKEMHRSFFKSAFVHSLQQLIPEVRSEDLVPCKAGVRAQALLDDGRLVDDFLMVKGLGTLHVCNAPSPAATAALEIGKAIVRQTS